MVVVVVFGARPWFDHLMRRQSEWQTECKHNAAGSTAQEAIATGELRCLELLQNVHSYTWQLHHRGARGCSGRSVPSAFPHRG